MALPPKVWPGNVKSFQESAIFQSIRTLLARNKSAVSAGPIVPDEDAQSLRSRGNELLAQGRISEATDCYRRVVAMTPNDGLAHVNLGYGLMELGQLREAVDSFHHAIRLDATLLDAHFLLGQVQMQLHLTEEGIHSFRAALALKPDFDFAWFELGRAFEDLGQPVPALDAYAQALRINPGFTDAGYRRISLLLAHERWQEAIDFADQQSVAAAHPVFPMEKACALNGLERHEEALTIIDRSLAADPDDVPALSGKAAVLAAMVRHEEALEIYEKIIALQPGNVDALSNAGAACDRLRRFEQAMDFHRRAQHLQPKNPDVLYNLGCTLLSLRQCDEVVAICEIGLAVDARHANLHWNKAFAQLLLGQWEEGWKEYEWRWYAHALGPRTLKPVLSQPMWSGEPLKGKTIFLYAEQGLGDSIQLLRYIPVILAMGARIFLHLPAPLRPLCADWKSGCTLVESRDGRDIAASFDFQCPMFSLPLAFGTRVTNVPGAPYLRSDPVLKQAWEARLPARDGPRVGLVWSGNVALKTALNRSMSMAMLHEAMPPGYQFISLQKDVNEPDLAALEASGIFHAGQELRTFADTLALADCVDMVISIDTSVAHLVGALGKPLWVMLPFRPDWRWLLDREDSPWYPSARLFRQGENRSWQDVVNQVGRELPRALPLS